jgi:hypothetical protein
MQHGNMQRGTFLHMQFMTVGVDNKLLFMYSDREF